VGDDGDVPGMVPGRQIVGETSSPLVQVPDRLPAVRPCVGVSYPIHAQPRDLRADRGARRPLEHAEGTLTQPGIEVDGQPEYRCERGRRFQRPA